MWVPAPHVYVCMICNVCVVSIITCNEHKLTTGPTFYDFHHAGAGPPLLTQHPAQIEIFILPKLNVGYLVQKKQDIFCGASSTSPFITCFVSIWYRFILFSWYFLFKIFHFYFTTCCYFLHFLCITVISFLIQLSLAFF